MLALVLVTCTGSLENIKMIHSVTSYCKFCIYKDTITVHIISFEYPLINMAVYFS